MRRCFYKPYDRRDLSDEKNPFAEKTPAGNASSHNNLSHLLTSPNHQRKHHLLRLGLDCLTALADSLQDLFSVLVELELCNNDFAGVDANGDGLTVGLLAGDTFDVDEELQSIDRCDFAFSAFVGTSDDGNLVILSDGNAANLFVER